MAISLASIFGSSLVLFCLVVLVFIAISEPTSALHRSSAGVASVTDTNCHIAPLSKAELTSFGALERKELAIASFLHRSALTVPCRGTTATFVLALRISDIFCASMPAA